MSENKDVVLNTNVNLFVMNYAKINPQYLTNMGGALKAIIDYLQTDTINEDEEKPELFKFLLSQEAELTCMYNEPVKYFLNKTIMEKRQKDYFLETIPQDLTINEIEWIVYRESQFRTKLRKKFNSSTGWRAAKNRITFGEAIRISGLLKQDMYKILTRLLQNFHIENLNIILPLLQEERGKHEP